MMATEGINQKAWIDFWANCKYNECVVWYWSILPVKIALLNRIDQRVVCARKVSISVQRGCS